MVITIFLKLVCKDLILLAVLGLQALDIQAVQIYSGQMRAR